MQVLDVGCGVGGPMANLARHTGASFVGINLNAYQIERAKNHTRDLGSQCRFIHGDFMQVPEDDDHYDAARVAADARLARRAAPRMRLALTIPGGSNVNLAQIVHRALSDRIRVVSGNPVVNADFFIEGMELKATARTGELTARWLVEEA